MLLSYTIDNFSLFYGGYYLQIWALLTRSQCKVFYTQVTVKACRLLVSIIIVYIVSCFYYSHQWWPNFLRNKGRILKHLPKFFFVFQVNSDIFIIISQEIFNFIWFCQKRTIFLCANRSSLIFLIKLEDRTMLETCSTWLPYQKWNEVRQQPLNNHTSSTTVNRTRCKLHGIPKIWSKHSTIS